MIVQNEQVIVQNEQVMGTVLRASARASAKAGTELFDAEELKIMEQVCTLLVRKKSHQLSEQSHEEVAWKDHHALLKQIPFEDAFTLTIE